MEGVWVLKFLLVSSAAVYGVSVSLPITEESDLKPHSIYGLSKYTAERYLNYFSVQYGLPSVVVRPANVYGPRQTVKGEAAVVAKFAHAFIHNNNLIIDGQGQQTRDFIYVTDVAAGIVAALIRGNGVFNLSTNTEISIRELVVRLGEVMGVVPQVGYAPARKSDIGRSVLLNSRARRTLSWQPQMPLLDGLRLTLKWYKDNPRV